MPIDFSNIKTTRNRHYDSGLISGINDSLQYLPRKQRAYILGTMIEESGGDPLAKSENGTYQGLLQWGADRYRIASNNQQEELANQLQYLRNTLNDTVDHKSWTHGGEGSGFNSFREAYNAFNDTTLPLSEGYRGFSYGYVRPAGKEDSYNNRLKVVQQVYDRLGGEDTITPTAPVRRQNFIDRTWQQLKNAMPRGYSGKWSEGGFLPKPRDAWDSLSLPEQSEMMRVAVRNGITDLKTIREKYNEFAEGGNLLDDGGSLTPQQEAMRYFMDKGLTDYQAAGLVGNLVRESQLIPTATNASSGAYGIAQWLGPRKKALVSRYGKTPTLRQQLDFVWDELNSTHKTGLSKLKSSRDVAEAARNAMGYYEFSAGPEAAVREMKKWGQDGEGSMRKGIKFASALLGQPVPEYTPPVQEVPVVQEAPAFVPVHPEVFGLPVARREEPIVYGLPEPTVEAVKIPTEVELKRQERQEGMRRLNMLLGMLNSTDDSSPYDGVVSMLTGSSVQPFSKFGEGGGIHIKPENRGKFTRLKERTGHSATWFKEHGTPAQKKMATFALNARHWKHAFGGNLFDSSSKAEKEMREGKTLHFESASDAQKWMDSL